MKKRNKRLILLLALSVGFVIASRPTAEAAYEYKSYGRKDPFIPLVGVSGEGTIGGLLGIVSVDDVSFQGVVVSADGRYAAIINGEIFKEGDSEGGVVIRSIGSNELIMQIGEEIHKLKLYE